MSRRRWARRCSGHRRDGAACGAFAIAGGAVCRAHGGSAPQVRAAASLRLLQDAVERSVAHDQAAHRERVLDWLVQRVEHAAKVLEIPPEWIREPDLFVVGACYGWPAGLETDARPELRADRRFKCGRISTATPRPAGRAS